MGCGQVAIGLSRGVDGCEFEPLLNQLCLPGSSNKEPQAGRPTEETSLVGRAGVWKSKIKAPTDAGP